MKVWSIHTTEYYSARNKTEIMKVTSKWMAQEKMILILMAQVQKYKCCMSIISAVPSYRSSDGSINMEPRKYKGFIGGGH